MSGLLQIFVLPWKAKGQTAVTFAILSLVVATSSAQAYCSVPPIRSVDNFARGSMEMTNAESCSAYYNSDKPTHAMEVAVRPRNGTVALGIASVTYTPRRGFVGKDSFLVLHGTNYLGKQLRARTIFDVTVSAPGR